MYIYTYIVHVYLQELRVLRKTSFTMVSPPLKWWWGFWGKFIGRGCCTWGKLMIRSCQRRGSFINVSSNSLNTVNFFANHVGILT